MKFLLLALFVSCSLAKPVTPIDEPPINDKPHKFEKMCFIGDGGTGDNNQYYVAEALEKEQCSRIIYVGDVVYEAGINSPNDRNFFKKFRDPYAKLLHSTPFYISLGNHDWYWFGSGSHWIELNDIYENIIYPNYNYAFRIGDICLTQFEVYKESLWNNGLDMNRKLNESGFYNKCKLKIGFSHYPYYSSGKHGDSPDKIKSHLQKMGVGNVFNVYVAGHDHHLSDEGYKGRTRLFISGSAGKLRKLDNSPRVWGVSKRGYLVITYEEGKAGYYFVTVEGKIIRREHSGELEI